MTSWRQIFQEELNYCKETWQDVVYCTLSNIELDKLYEDHKFDIRWSTDNDDMIGVNRFAWTKTRVYFIEWPNDTDYRDMPWCKSVPRNPS